MSEDQKENIITEILKNSLCMKCGENLFVQMGKTLDGKVALYVSPCNVCQNVILNTEEDW